MTAQETRDAARTPDWRWPSVSDGRLALGLIVAFALFNLIALDRMPLVNQDEPWIAEPGLHFWRTGVFASELHRGFFGVERHFLLHAPLFSIAVGGVIALLGPGLYQARLVSLALATATAALTFALGRRLFSPRHGLLAVLILTVWRVAAEIKIYPSGIPLVDLGRLSRYDIGVPVLTVAACLIVLPLMTTVRPVAALTRGAIARLLIAGALVGIGVSCHPAALAWAPMISAGLLVTRGWRDGVRPCLWLAAGTLAGFVPYAAWIASGWRDFLLQQEYVADRYDLFNPRFYLENLWQEWRRYGPIGRGLLSLQPGAWLIATSGLVGLHALWRRRAEDAPGPRVLLAALVVGAGLFALGMKPKLYNYVATLWPMIALMAAVGLLALLRASSRMVRVATIVMVLAACGDGLRGWHLVTVRALSVTPYGELCDRLAAQIPPDSRVLALPHYWFGLAPRVRMYRSLFGPMLFISPNFASRHPPLATLLDAADANVLVLDPPMLTFLEESRDPTKVAYGLAGSATALQAYLSARSERVVTVDVPSYGRFEIHFLRPWPAAAQTTVR
jgi:4-amino-4-deoxy-L-arabinose transferase-like glycosyltransferase